MIYVYSDGSSTGGRGAGGYGWIIVINDEVWYAGYGSSNPTTNNLMEMQGAFSGLSYLIEHPIDDPDGITLMSDSAYVIGISDGSYVPHKNIDEATRMRALALQMGIKCQWVRGHSGNVYNEAADSLAKMGKRGYHKDPKQRQITKRRRKRLIKHEA
jgi:ribonuclease HI